MNKSYNFQMKVNGCTRTVTISVPYENGIVITSEFCPPQLLATGAGPLPWLQTSLYMGSLNKSLSTTAKCRFKL